MKSVRLFTASLGLLAILLASQGALAQGGGADVLVATVTQPTAGDVAPGTDDHPCLQFTLTLNFGAPATNFTALDVNQTGTADATDVPNFDLYLDDGTSPGFVDNGDTHLASGSLSGGVISFSGFNTAINTVAQGGSPFLVVADVATGATDGRTIILDFAPADVTVDPNTSTVGGQSPQGNTQTIQTPSGPVMDVRRGGNSIPSGQLSNDDVGTITIGTGTVLTWNIHNVGTTQLDLMGSPDAVTLTNQFGLNSATVTQPASTAIAALGDEPFDIEINPSAQNFGFTVNIPSNDPASPYVFNVTGTGQTASATDLVITTQPGGGTGGVVWAQQPVVEAHDSGGAIDTSFNGSVTAEITTGTGTMGASLLGTVTVTASNGVADFTDLAVDLAGTGYTLDFTSGSLNPATSNAFDITVGPAAELVITTEPGNGEGGTALSTQPELEIQDAGGNVVTSDNSTVVNATITSGTGATGAQIVAGGSATASSGIVTFGGLAIDLAGTGYTLDFDASGMSTVTSGTFDVTVGPADALRVSVQPDGAVANTAFATQPEVEIVDAGGNVVTGATNPVTAAITNSTGTSGANLGGTNNPATPAGGTGTAVFTDLEIDLVGTGYTLDFTASGLTPATSDPFGVAGNPAQLAVRTQPGGAVENQQFVTQPVIEIQDSNGTLVSTATTAVTVTITSGSGAFLGSSTTTENAVGGVVTFQNLGIDTAGLGYVLHFDDGGSLTDVDSASFDVAGTATQIVIVTQPGGAAPATAFTQQPVLEIHDANGVLVATDSSTTVDVSITSGTGAMSAMLGGTTSVTAVDGVVTFTDLEIDLAGSGYTLDFADQSTTLPTVTSASFDVTSGSSGGGGGGGDDDEGCSTGSSNGWFMLAGLLALLALATRLRTRES